MPRALRRVRRRDSVRFMDLADWLRLDVPVGQAGMGGGLTGPELAAAVASAGGLGTLGLALPDQLRDSIRQIRGGAPGRAVVVNLLTPFLRRRHVSECVNSRIVAAVVAFAGDRALVDKLRGAGVFVFVMVGTDRCCLPAESQPARIPGRRWRQGQVE